jgi:hypothetical protein
VSRVGIPAMTIRGEWRDDFAASAPPSRRRPMTRHPIIKTLIHTLLSRGIRATPKQRITLARLRLILFFRPCKPLNRSDLGALEKTKV